MMVMTTVQLESYHLPMVNEANYLEDPNGEFIHPNRKLSDLHVFIFIQSGEIEVVEDKTTYTLTAGDYLFLHKGIKHWGTKPYQPNTSWYYIHFFASTPSQTSEFNWTPSPPIISKETYQKVITLPKTGHMEQVDYISAKLSQLIDQQNSGPLRQSLSCYELFLDLYQQEKKTRQKPQVEAIVKHVTQLCQASDSKIASEEFSQKLHLNYPYISTVFKQATGKTISQYQNELMIERAITLFNQTDYNITEVSEMLDCANPFYFSRVFKKVTGISPSSYLKQRYHQ